MRIQKVVGIILLSIGICLIAFGGYKLFLEPKPEKDSNQTKSIYYIKRINQQSTIQYEAQFAENKDILLTVTDYYVEESTEADKNTITISD